MCCWSKHNVQPKHKRIHHKTKGFYLTIQNKHTDLYSKDMEECGVFPVCVHSGTFCLFWL